jgi:hypothetical protein
MNVHYAQSRKRVIRRQYSSQGSKATAEESIDKRSLYARKKCDGLICSVCQGPAHGYNFDAITCESCKAFFRRNALKSDVGEHRGTLSNSLIYYLGDIQMSVERRSMHY